MERSATEIHISCQHDLLVSRVERIGKQGTLVFFSGFTLFSGKKTSIGYYGLFW